MEVRQFDLVVVDPAMIVVEAMALAGTWKPVEVVVGMVEWMLEEHSH